MFVQVHDLRNKGILCGIGSADGNVMVTDCGVEGVCHLTQTTWLSPAGMTISLTR